MADAANTYETESVRTPYPAGIESQKRILLTTSAAPTQSPFSTKEKRPPIGIGFMIAVLRDAGHQTFFIDNYLQRSDFLESNYLQENEIDYVGVYANTICFRDTLGMINKLEYMRQRRKWNGKIIVGGPHTTVAPHTIPDFVDYVVQGEGEHAICDIVEGKITDRIVKYPRIENLDALPMPAWDCFVNLPYDWSVDFFPENPVFTMNTSRGCPFRCAFCSVASIWGRSYKCFSAERIVSDIEHLIERYGAKGIYFREDNFTLNEERLRKFCNLLMAKEIRISWVCESRVSSLNRDLVQLMARAGAKGFYFGVESGSQRILDFLEKGTNVEQIENAFRWCHEFGVKTAASVIVGVPGETESDRKQTRELLTKINPTITWFNVFVGIPDSNLYRFVLNNRLYQYIDDRGLVYLQGHNSRVQHYYGDSWNALIPDTEENKDWTNKPKVSVLICAYNDEKFVKQALESIYSQTYQDFEVIVVDDGSTDRTSEILGNLKDSRTFIYRNAQNQGLTKSLNTGLKLCRGQYIARMDADDVSHPQRFEKQTEFLDENRDVALVGSSYYRINDEGKTIAVTTVLTDCQQIKQGLWKQNWFGHGTVMVRRTVLSGLGGYDEKYKFAQDYDLWLRIAEKYNVGNIEEPLYYWRSNAACISDANRQQQQYYKNLAISEARKRQSCQHALIAQSLGQAKSSPMVSVIVPTYNRLDLLARALKSILNQTYRNFEIIVVNDAGTSAEGVVTQLNAERNILYISHNKNKGLAAARNTGIRAAKGKYIAYLDDDDIYYPNHLELLVNALENSEHKVAHTEAYRAKQEQQNGAYVVVERTTPYSSDIDHDKLLVRNLVPVLCVMHEKSCLEKVGYFDESLPTHEDWDLWIRMSKKFKFLHIREVTAEVAWRTDGTTMTSQKKKEFLTVPQIIYDKYKDDATNKPQIAAEQNRRIQNLRRKYAETSAHFPENLQASINQGAGQHGSKDGFTNQPQTIKQLCERINAKSGLHVAVKTCTPSRQNQRWGDTWFANGLATAIRKAGHVCEVHFRDEWYPPRQSPDVVIHIKGRFRYAPAADSVNIIWIVSHPELHAPPELNQFDAIFCASEAYLQYIKHKVQVPCFYLPQATDEELFKPVDPNPQKDIDILFVGTNYYPDKRRKIVQDVLDTGKEYNLWVIGKFWQGLLDERYLKAEYVDPQELPQLYSRAKIVLNDHHETMRQFGFINNRTYDVAALKVFQISDHVQGLDELGVVTYHRPEDLRQKLDYFLGNEQERQRIAKINHERCRNFTFGSAAQLIMGAVKELSDNEKLGGKAHQEDDERLPKSPTGQAKGPRPKVSVVVACYNCARFLPECLDSIRSQALRQWELLLIDDASTDGTAGVIEKYAQMDARIRPYYFSDNRGPYIRRNFAIEQADSDFIVIQDADDMMVRDKLERLHGEIAQDERLGIVGSFYRMFLDEFKGAEHTEEILLATTHEQIINDYTKSAVCDFCWHGSAIIRKELFEELGPYDENPFGSDSFWLAKVAEYVSRTNEVKLKNIPEFLTLRRMHLDSQTGSLPVFDPRSRRARYRDYQRNRLAALIRRLDRNPDADAKTELRQLVCNDFVEKYGHLFEKWENEPLTNEIMRDFIARILSQFKKGQFVRCIATCEIVDQLVDGFGRMVRCYNLVRGLAYFAVGLPRKSRECLERELHTHGTAAAGNFVRCFVDKYDASWSRIDRAKIVGNAICRCGQGQISDSAAERAAACLSPPHKSAHVSYGARQSEPKRAAHEAPETNPVPAELARAMEARESCCKPKVTVVTSCHNCERFLPECLESVRTQTMQEWELFLLDDGSTDGTRQIIKQYSQMDNRIKPYFFQSNEGPYVRRNFAIERANSDFIVIQDADDIMSPAKLQILYDEITKDQQLGVVGSFFRTCLGEFKGSEYADSIELPTTHDRIMEQYASTLYICWHGSTIIRKSLFETIGLYDENPFGSDTLWLAKAAEYARYSNEIRFKNIPVYLTVKREHASSQQGRLPIVDPRSRRAKFRIFWLHKLLKIREKLQKNPAVDMKAELRNCKCNDYMNRYSSFFEQWESEPLGNSVIGYLVNTAVILFNDHRYVSCITTLNGMEVSLGDMAKRFKNYDLLRAMAFFAIDMKEQSLAYLNREIQNHNNPAAKQFIYDYFEGPHSTRRSQSGNVKKQFQTDVQKWCADHSDIYELQMIDTRIVPEAV